MSLLSFLVETYLRTPTTVRENLAMIEMGLEPIQLHVPRQCCPILHQEPLLPGTDKVDETLHSESSKCGRLSTFQVCLHHPRIEKKRQPREHLQTHARKPKISFSLISKTPACSASWLCHSSHRNGAKGYPGATILPYENDEVAPCSRSDRATRVHPANLEGRLLGKFEVHQAFLHGSFPK